MSESDNNKSVFVIILTYNNFYDTSITIHSFLKQNKLLKIILVDNNSKDDSYEKLKIIFSNSVILIQNKENLGYTGGNNEGIKYALENGADYIVIANNDIEFSDPLLTNKLINTHEKYQDIGILGVCQHNGYNKENKAISNKTIFPNSKYKFNVFKNVQDLPDHIEPVDYVVGFFMFIKKDVFTKAGLFDNEFFLYGEDSEFGLRAWRKGYKSAIDLSISIFHKGSVSTGNDSPLKYYYKTRNLFLLIHKTKLNQENHSYFHFYAFKKIVKEIIKLFLSNKPIKYKAKQFSAIIKAFIDILFRKTGNNY